MILSGKAIEGNIRSGTIGIEPEPTEEQYQPASLDLRLGPTIYDTKFDETFHSPDEDDLALELNPGIPYIGHTMDEISLPDDMAAMMTGRSSVGRAGVIVHKTAGWIDPGFSGQLTLEMYNFGDEPVHLTPGDRIAQLVFFPTDQKTRGYTGQYQGQSGITIHGDHGGKP